MFTTHRVTINATYPEVLSRLPTLINRGALHGIAEKVYDGGLTNLLRVGPFGGLPGLSKLVRVRTLDPVQIDGKTTIALRWEATGLTGELFPALDGQLTLMPAANDRCEVELLGIYRPPFGRAGKLLDQKLMEHLAEATIRAFLDETTAILRHPITSKQLST
jgi:hypothetical protein